MSERRACKATVFCRMTVRYKTTREDDASLRERMKAIARERRRFGYRRLHVLLRREGKRGLSFILTAAFAFGALGVLKQYAIELMTIFLAFFWAYLLVKLLPLKNRWWQ